MNIDIQQYRAAIGKFDLGTHALHSLKDCTHKSVQQLIISVALIVSKMMVFIMWPFLLALFIFLNCSRFFSYLLRLRLRGLRGLDNFKSFINIIFLHASLTLIFIFKLVMYVYMKYTIIKIILFPWLIVIFDLSYILLQSGDIEIQPGPQLFPKLKIAYWNLGGLSTDNFIKKTSLEAFLSINKLDIMMIGETHLNDNFDDRDLEIPGYTLKRCDHNENLPRGGVCVYYKSSLPISIKPDLTFLNECIVMELKVGRKKCFITFLYRSPANNAKDHVDKFVDSIENTLSAIGKNNPYVSILLGDFNAKNSNWWGNINDYQGIQIDFIAESYGYKQLINEATNFEPHSEPSCIDLIFASEPNLIHNSGTLPSLIERCHHQMIFAEINFKVFLPPSYKRKIWDYKNADVNKINESLSRINWDNFLRGRNPNEQIKFLNDCILNVFSNYCPNKIITCNDKDTPWMTDDIRKLLKEKEYIYKQYVKNGYLDSDKSNLKNKQKECSQVISAVKDMYLITEGEKLNDPHLGPKKYWSILNRFLNKKKIPLIPPIFHNDDFVTDAKMKADIFNNYFASQCTPIINDSVLPNPDYRTDARLCNIDINNTLILDIISALNPNKSHGCDNISIKMIQICKNQIVSPLTFIFVTCMNLGVYPDLWKMSNVCPVHKKESKNVLKNYRPISLLPIFSKIFEKIIYNSLYGYITHNKLLNQCQSGFQKGDSCVSQLLKITNDIFRNLDSDPSTDTRSIFLDMSKAFDKVWHEGLLYKLRVYGIHGDIYNLLTNYLMGRQQRTLINGQVSGWKPITAGVPQGSVLGPLLFLLYVNDLPDKLLCSPKLFADDVSLNDHMNNIAASTERLNQDLNNIEEWAHQWKMLFNPDLNKPANEVIFSNRGNTNLPKLFFAGNTINTVKYHKHLGLILDSRLDFNQHLKEKIGKANTGIFMIRRLYRYLPRKTLLNVYKAFVRPHLDYCDIIYHRPCLDSLFQNNVSPISYNPNMLFTDKIESVQYNAALAITGCIRGTSKEKIYNELGIESLYNRRTFHRLLYLYKIKNDLLPRYLKDEIPNSVVNRFNTRHHRSSWISSRTNKYKYSFFPHSINAWNGLSSLIKNSSSPNIFKSRYMSFFHVNANSIFGIHNSTGIKLLTRLRVGLSHLREHKYNHNFIDTSNPFCSCDGKSIESTEHYLLRCPNHTLYRDVLFENLNNIDYNFHFESDYKYVQVLLYGNNTCDGFINRKILESTIEFLINSSRFDESLLSYI